MIEGKPADIKLLRQELNALKGSSYYFETLSQLRGALDSVYESRFFSRDNKRFFGDAKYKWSVKYQTLTIVKSTGDAQYQPVIDSDGKLTLRCV